MRPHITVVLAMSADGKIADATRAAARFPSEADKARLERHIASTDATLFGAGTLRAYETTLPVLDQQLIGKRRSHHQPDQPIQIVCSATGKLMPTYRFFQQPVPRWLLTTVEGLETWHSQLSASKTDTSLIKDASECIGYRYFEHTLITERPFNWKTVLQDLSLGKAALSKTASRPAIERLLVMGGGELVASLLAEDYVDELYLTLCPLIIGGKTAPTPVGGLGFRLPHAPQLKLLSSEAVGDEIFLHYKTIASVRHS